MLQYSLLRYTTFLIAAALPFVGRIGIDGKLVIIAMTVTHYFLAVPYSRKQVSHVLTKRDSSIKLLVLVGLAAFFSFVKVDNLLLYLFGFHYVFSEVYLFHQRFFGQLGSQLRLLRASSICFNLTVYFLTVQKESFGFPALIQTSLVALSSAATIALCVFLFKLRNTLTRKQWLTAASFESFSLVLLAVSLLIGEIPLLTFVFYHVLFWLCYPTYCFWESGRYRNISIYLAQNITLFTVLMLLSPKLGFPIHLSMAQYGFVFYAGSLFHILTTLSLSNAQPEFLTRFFNSSLLQDSNNTGQVSTIRSVVMAK